MNAAELEVKFEWQKGPPDGDEVCLKCGETPFLNVWRPFMEIAGTDVAELLSYPALCGSCGDALFE
jgi:hypothetical protein